MLHFPNTSLRILKQLLYSEVFGHPLTSKELAFYIPCETDELLMTLNELTELKLIIHEGDYYYLFQHANKISKRISGEQKANQFISKAHKVGAFIQRFPFVKGVAILE